MATFVSAKYVSMVTASVAYVHRPFLPEEEYAVLHMHKTVHVPTSCSFYISGTSLICTDSGLKGGGSCVSPQPKKRVSDSKEDLTPTTNIVVPDFSLRKAVNPKDAGVGNAATDEEARDAFHDLTQSLQVSDLPGISQASKILIQNSAETDGQLLDLIIPAFTSGNLWNIGDAFGALARLDLIQLLRLSTVRHAIRAHEGPGFIYAQKLRYREMLEQCVNRIVKLEKTEQEVDLQAELRASWAVIFSIEDERDIWDKLKLALPKLANLAGFVDPIRYAGTLLRGMFDTGEMVYDKYQYLKSTTLAKQVVILSIVHIGRHNVTMEDVEMMRNMLKECNRWNTAVLLIRLAALIVFERIVTVEIRLGLLEIIEECTSFKKFVFRNNWKVRKSALFNLLQISKSKQEPEIAEMVEELLEMRALIESDKNVLSTLDLGSRLESAQKLLKQPKYKERIQREVSEIHSQMKSLYSTIHQKDEQRVKIVSAELKSAAESIDSLTKLERGRTTVTSDIHEKVELLRHRTEIMASNIDKIKDLLDRPHTAKTVDPAVRVVPQRNLDGDQFIGRTEELSLLHSLYRHTSMKAVILGEPGIGKSTLALKFVYQAEEEGLFTSFVWLNAQKSSTMFPDYLDAAYDLNATHGNDADKVKYAKNRLKSSKTTLLIYDNADLEDQSTDAEIDNFLKLHFLFGHASVLVTSRNEEWKNRLSEQIRVQPLKEREGMMLLQVVSTLPADEISPHLVKQLEGNPLAIRTAGKYLKQSRNEISLERKLTGESLGPQDKPMDRLMNVCIESFTPQGRTALESCSYLNPDRIDPRVTSRMMKSCKVSQQTTAIAELQSLLLVEVRNGNMQMHRVVQDTAFNHCRDKPQLEKTLSTCLVEMIEAGLDFDPDIMLNARYFHDKKQSLTNENRKIDKALVKYCLKNRLGAEARKICFVEMKEQEILEKELTPREILDGYLRQAEACALDDQHEEAERLYKQSYEIAKEFPEDLLQVCYRLASYQRSKDELQMGRVYIQKALELMPTLGANLPPRVRLDIYYLGGLFLSLEDQIGPSLECFQKALDLANPAISSPSEIGAIHTALADMYLNHIGYESEAIQELNSALVSLQSVPTDPIQARIYRTLANNHKAEREKRMQFLNLELQFRKAHLPAEEKGLAETWAEIGDLYKQMNNYTEALTCMEEAQHLFSIGDPQLPKLYDKMAQAAIATGNEDLALKYRDMMEKSRRQVAS